MVQLAPIDGWHKTRVINYFLGIVAVRVPLRVYLARAARRQTIQAQHGKHEHAPQRVSQCSLKSWSHGLGIG